MHARRSIMQVQAVGGGRTGAARAAAHLCRCTWLLLAATALAPLTSRRSTCVMVHPTPTAISTAITVCSWRRHSGALHRGAGSGACSPAASGKAVQQQA